MSAAVTDHFKKVKGFFSTTLASQKNSGSGTMSLSDATDVPTDTGLIFTVGRVDSSGTPTPSTRAIYKGTLSGTTVSNLTLAEGTDQTHTAGTVVEITWTGTHVNDMVDGLLEEHKQDGTHGDVTATSVSTDTISENTPANGVSVDGLNIKDGKLNTNDSVVTNNITDGAVTSAKNAPIVIYESGGSASTTGSPADATGITTTFTCATASVALVWLDGYCSIDVSEAGALNFVLDVDAGTSTHTKTVADNNNTSPGNEPWAASVHFVVPLTAASHTLKMQIDTTGSQDATVSGASMLVLVLNSANATVS